MTIKNEVRILNNTDSIQISCSTLYIIYYTDYKHCVCTSEFNSSVYYKHWTTAGNI